MIVSPLNNVVLKLSTKYIGNYSNIMKAANLNPANKLNPADLVNIMGEVVSVPLRIRHERSYKGFTTKDIEVGDVAIFRYDVVFDLVERPDSQVPLYRNMVWYKQKEYWLADIIKIFGVIKKETQSIKMLNGYVMLEDVEPESQIFVPQHSKRMIRAKEATLRQIGNPLEGEKMVEAFPDDRVLVHPLRMQHYQINGKKFSICKQKDIFGRVLK